MAGVTDSILLDAADYTVTRRGAGTLVNGLHVPNPSTTTFTISASIQPVDGLTVEGAPEGRNVHDLQVLWTTTNLVAVDPAHGVGDIVTIDGERWEVVKRRRWSDMRGGKFTVAYIAREVSGTTGV